MVGVVGRNGGGWGGRQGRGNRCRLGEEVGTPAPYFFRWGIQKTTTPLSSPVQKGLGLGHRVRVKLAYSMSLSLGYGVSLLG